MKIKAIMALALSASMLACNSGKKDEQLTKSTDKVIGKPEVNVQNGIMTPEILHSFGKVSDVQVSPDKSKILFGISYADIKQNKSNRDLYVMNIDGSEKKQLTQTPESENNAVWIKDGTKIAYLSTAGGSSQIWIMGKSGQKKKQISNIEGDITGFAFSPDNTKVLYTMNVKYGERTVDKHADLPKATGKVIDDIMYKHWDQWVEEIPHSFVADYNGEIITGGTDILAGEPYEAPMLPFGGMEQLAWTPDGKNVAYTSKKKTGKEYAVSTNSDIYLYNLESGKTENLTEGMMGYDINPTFSPDGKYMAWQSMERDGYEADKNRLFILNMETKEKSYITEKYDNNADAIIWNSDNQSIYMVSCVEAKTQLFKVYVHTKEIVVITSGVHDYESCALAGDDKLIAVRHSMSKPNEIYAVNLKNGEATELSFENKALLEQVQMGKVEERWITTTDNKRMLTWVVYPPNFDPAKKYPAILYCQGGPQSTVSQFWSYRWNLQMMAANGYIIVAPNRRGLPSFGQEWLEQISGDYGGQNMKDYLSAIDELSKEPYVNKDKLGCTGASYGGFSTYWLAGNHNKRFKAFFAHAGIFNLEAQYLETEEMFFANWDMGGAYWDKANKTAQKTYATSPHRFVDRWDTPIMISHGELDYRIVASQGMQAFNAAQLRGIPSRLLIYPNENHWIAQPQNGVLFQREFFRWFDTYLK